MSLVFIRDGELLMHCGLYICGTITLSSVPELTMTTTIVLTCLLWLKSGFADKCDLHRKLLGLSGLDFLDLTSWT